MRHQDIKAGDVLAMNGRYRAESGWRMDRAQALELVSLVEGLRAQVADHAATP